MGNFNDYKHWGLSDVDASTMALADEVRERNNSSSGIYTGTTTPRPKTRVNPASEGEFCVLFLIGILGWIIISAYPDGTFPETGQVDVFRTELSDPFILFATFSPVFFNLFRIFTRRFIFFLEFYCLFCGAYIFLNTDIPILDELYFINVAYLSNILVGVSSLLFSISIFINPNIRMNIRLIFMIVMSVSFGPFIVPSLTLMFADIFQLIIHSMKSDEKYGASGYLISFLLESPDYWKYAWEYVWYASAILLLYLFPLRKSM